MSKASKVAATAAVPPKAVPAPAPVAAAALAAEVVAEAPVEAENGAPVFTLLPGGDEFSVNISNQNHGRWVNAARGQYFQSTRTYNFLLSKLDEVEKGLGMKPGSSGLKDPKFYSKILLTAEVYSADGLEELKEKLAPLGITYKRQNKCFVGPISAYEGIKPFMEAPKQ